MVSLQNCEQEISRMPAECAVEMIKTAHSLLTIESRHRIDKVVDSKQFSTLCCHVRVTAYVL